MAKTNRRKFNIDSDVCGLSLMAWNRIGCELRLFDQIIRKDTLCTVFRR